MKIIKEQINSSTFVLLDGPEASIASGPNAMITTKDSGNFINGPLSISSPVDNIKVGGMYKFNPLLSTGLPSTMITPIPTLVMDIPFKNIASFESIANIARSII